MKSGTYDFSIPPRFTSAEFQHISASSVNLPANPKIGFGRTKQMNATRNLVRWCYIPRGADARGDAPSAAISFLVAILDGARREAELCPSVRLPALSPVHLCLRVLLSVSVATNDSRGSTSNDTNRQNSREFLPLFIGTANDVHCSLFSGPKLLFSPISHQKRVPVRFILQREPNTRANPAPAPLAIIYLASLYPRPLKQ